jgi:hypothetical protein
MKKQTQPALMFILMLLPFLLFGQRQQEIDLAAMYKKGKLKAVNREIKIVSGGSGTYLEIAPGRKEGLVWLDVKNFKNGTIEIEMRGKDVFQRSFIGIAFHGADESTYDAVYCRPFNFLAKDSVRRIHALQYISHPDFPWDRLRKQNNAVFEKEISNPPDPDAWFTMKLAIDAAAVKAFINNAAKPSLTVRKLSSGISGKIGLFTADSSGGDFRIIRINYKK